MDNEEEKPKSRIIRVDNFQKDWNFASVANAAVTPIVMNINMITSHLMGIESAGQGATIGFIPFFNDRVTNQHDRELRSGAELLLSTKEDLLDWKRRITDLALIEPLLSDDEKPTKSSLLQGPAVSHGDVVKDYLDKNLLQTTVRVRSELVPYAKFIWGSYDPEKPEEPSETGPIYDIIDGIVGDQEDRNLLIETAAGISKLIIGVEASMSGLLVEVLKNGRPPEQDFNFSF